MATQQQCVCQSECTRHRHHAYARLLLCTRTSVGGVCHRGYAAAVRVYDTPPLTAPVPEGHQGGTGQVPLVLAGQHPAAAPWQLCAALYELRRGVICAWCLDAASGGWVWWCCV